LCCGGEGLKKQILGIPDTEFVRGDVPMTKNEIRILVMAKAAVKPHDIILDIGAGTGSLSIEAALLAPQGKVYAVEKNPEALELIRMNREHFGTGNLEVLAGTAPAALQSVPQVDVVFVGGSGGQLKEILEAAFQLLKPGGRMVVTAVLLETLQESLAFMQGQPGFFQEAFAAQITRVQSLTVGHMLQALNPVYIIVGSKGE